MIKENYITSSSCLVSCPRKTLRAKCQTHTHILRGAYRLESNIIKGRRFAKLISGFVASSARDRCADHLPI